MRDGDHEFCPLPGVPAGQIDFALVRYDVMGHGTRRGHDLACAEIRFDIAVQISVLILVGAVHAKEGFAARRFVRAFDEIDLPATGETVSDADPDPGILVGIQLEFDILQSVVSARTAGTPHPQGAEREVQVVGNHDQVLQREVQLLHPVADGVTAEVHVRGRLEQGEMPALERNLGDSPVPLRGENDIGCLSPGIQDHKSHVVAG